MTFSVAPFCNERLLIENIMKENRGNYCLESLEFYQWGYFTQYIILVVSWNLWLILICKIWLFLYLVKHIKKILRITNLCLFLCSFSSCWVFSKYVNKSCKTYMGTMLPPVSRNDSWFPLIFQCSLILVGKYHFILEIKSQAYGSP